MRNWSSTKVSLALLTTCALAGTASAQQLDLPRPSPNAKVTQTVGLTDITVEYSSPGVKGRTIWGNLVPYDQLWRTGANGATKVTFSKDVTIGDKAVPAGTYAIFSIPSTKNPWTLILNKNPNQGNTQDYKQELDLLRLLVKPQAIPLRERLTFLVADFSDNSASLDLEWEKVKVSIPIKLNTDAQALANIKAATDNAWRPFNSAARYQMDKKDWDGALKLVDQSLSLREEWFNVFTKAQILAARGNHKAAYPLAEKAKVLGDKNPDTFFFADEVKKALADWKGKK